MLVAVVALGHVAFSEFGALSRLLCHLTSLARFRTLVCDFSGLAYELFVVGLDTFPYASRWHAWCQLGLVGLLQSGVPRAALGPV